MQWLTPEQRTSAASTSSHLAQVWVNAILRSAASGRDQRNIATSSPLRRPFIRDGASETFVLFQLYFPGTQFASGGVVRIGFSFTVILACGLLAGDVVLPAEPGQPKPASAADSKGNKLSVSAATLKFGVLHAALLAATPDIVCTSR